MSRDGGTRPLWSPDGRELYYVSPTDALLSVSVESDPLKFGPPEMVLERIFTQSGTGRGYDISPDGERFLVIREADVATGGSSARVILVQNWTEELKRVVSVE